MEHLQWQKVPDPVERRHIAVMPEVDDAAGAGGASRLATRCAPGLKNRGLRGPRRGDQGMAKNANTETQYQHLANIFVIVLSCLPRKIVAI